MRDKILYIMLRETNLEVNEQTLWLIWYCFCGYHGFNTLGKSNKIN